MAKGEVAGRRARAACVLALNVAIMPLSLSPRRCRGMVEDKGEDEVVRVGEASGQVGVGEVASRRTRAVSERAR